MPAAGGHMRCPKCRLPLRPIKHAGVALDICVECKGLWFDGTEVQRVIGAETARPFQESLSGSTSRPARVRCPRGHGALREVTLELDAGRHRADAAGCPQCGGVWMERGDLARIRPHLPTPAVASDARIETLHLRVNEAQREADEERIAAVQDTEPAGGRHWLFQFLLGLPIEVHSPIRTRPVVTYGLIALNVLVFAVQLWFLIQPLPEDLLITRFGLQPNAFVHGVSMWTIFTSMFMHGGVLHLAGNMYFLGVFGDNVEDRLGTAQYLGLYLLGGVVAALAHIVSDPSSTIPLIGASGAVSAVLGAYVYFFPQRRIYMMIFFALKRIRAIWYLGLWLAMQIYFAAGGAPGVAWWAHIGGFVLGYGAAALHRAVVRRRLQEAAAA